MPDICTLLWWSEPLATSPTVPDAMGACRVFDRSYGRTVPVSIQVSAGQEVRPSLDVVSGGSLYSVRLPPASARSWMNFHGSFDAPEVNLTSHSARTELVRHPGCQAWTVIVTGWRSEGRTIHIPVDRQTTSSGERQISAR